MSDMNDPGLKSESEQQEILNKPIEQFTDQPAMQALLSEDFAKKSNLDALEVANALQAILKGQAEIAKNQQQQAEELRKLKEWTAARDEDARKYSEDPLKFAQDVSNQANKLRVTGSEKDRLIAEAVQMKTNAIQEAKAEAANEYLEFLDRVNKAPKVTVYSAGTTRRCREGANFINKHFPEEILRSVGGHTFRWILRIDEANEIPDFIASEYNKSKLDKRKREQLNNDLMVKEDGGIPNYGKMEAKYPELRMSGGSGNNVIDMNKGVK